MVCGSCGSSNQRHPKSTANSYQFIVCTKMRRLLAALAPIDGVGVTLRATKDASMTSSEFNELRTRAQNDDSEAMLDVAIAYSEGDGVEHNDEEFFSWIWKAAIAGEPEAAYELAYAYQAGIGTQPN